MTAPSSPALVAAGAAEGVGLPNIRVVNAAADESMGLQLSVPEPGGLVVTNTTDHVIEVSSRLITWRFAAGHDPGEWIPWLPLELVETCEPARPPACVTIPAGQSLTIVPWRFWMCGGQCLHGAMCRSNEHYSDGAWRYTIRACDASWEVAGPPFTPPSAGAETSVVVPRAWARCSAPPCCVIGLPALPFASHSTH